MLFFLLFSANLRLLFMTKEETGKQNQKEREKKTPTYNCFRFWSKLFIVQDCRDLLTLSQHGWEEHICTHVPEVQSDWDPSDPDTSPSDQLKTHLKKMLHRAKAALRSQNWPSYCPAAAGRRLLIQPQVICMAGTDEWNTSAGEKNPLPRYTKVDTSTRGRGEHSVGLNNCQRTELHFPPALRRNIRRS